MRSNVQNSISVKSQEIDNHLNDIEKALKDMVKMSIDEITADKEKEKELIPLWAEHANSISNFFFEQCERTGNKELYKGIVKYMMFKK